MARACLISTVLIFLLRGAKTENIVDVGETSDGLPWGHTCLKIGPTGANFIYPCLLSSQLTFTIAGHLTSRSDVYSFGVVLLEMLTGRRSMDKNRPTGEHNLVEWARPHLGERRRFYRLIDPRLEGHFSIKGAQKAAQLAAHCLSRDPKARPLMSEVVEALKPLPNLKDMASSSYYFQTMRAERMSPNARYGIQSQAGANARNRSLSIPNGTHASPYHHQYPHQSPKPNGKP